MNTYQFGPLRHFSHFLNNVVNKRMLPKVSSMEIPKLLLAAVRCEYGIIIFSTEIAYAESKRSDGTSVNSDFDLFDPDTLETVSLP